VKYSPQQDKALCDISRWLKSDDQVFHLFGYAGTGKTTLAKKIAEGIKDVKFSAYTGKAASVMKLNGCPEASTIHSLIYHPLEKSKKKLQELRAEFLHDPSPELERDIEIEEDNIAQPGFTLNLDSELGDADLLILDECSMVNEKIALDLMQFGTKILVMGDPAQLPPVKGEGYFMMNNPEIMLTEIHRQAKDNPIIRLATEVRSHRHPEPGEYGESRVIDRIFMNAEMVMEHDQMLVGRNVTRCAFNHRVREIKGIEDTLPVEGDKVICLRNDKDAQILNGELSTVEEIISKDPYSQVVMELDSGKVVRSHSGIFLGEKIPYHEKFDALEFDYGYAITTHKSQGSQWPSVLIYDESSAFRNNRWKWLYTAITRAQESVTLVYN